MKKKNKYLLVFILVLILIMVLLAFAYAIRVLHPHQVQVVTIYQTLLCYMHNNKAFPSSEKDLTEKGHLRKRQVNHEFIYEMRVDPTVEHSWYEIWDWDQFQITYDFDKEELFINDGKLWSKKTNSPFYILNGPRVWFLGDTFVYTSAKIYQQWQEVVKK